MIGLDDIPPLHGPRPDGAARIRRRAPADPEARRGPGRRSVIGGLAAAGGAAGLAVLSGAFPPARQARAQGFSLRYYTEIYTRCPSYASSHNCSPGCGPSVVCSGGKCCQTSGRWKGYHRSGSTNPGVYKLRPNQCYSGGWDGWLWKYNAPCGSCKRYRTYRCHDGWTKSSAGSWYKTICRWTVACGN